MDLPAAGPVRRGEAHVMCDSSLGCGPESTERDAKAMEGDSPRPLNSRSQLNHVQVWRTGPEKSHCPISCQND